MILLNKQKILSEIKSPSIRKKCHIEIFKSIPSTQDVLKNDARSIINICLAEQQTAGKGRMGRYWHSPFGENIYFSCVWKFRQPANELLGLSRIVGLSVISVLESLGIKNATIKWPNDILINQKKCAGILIETKSESKDASLAIIGIGMNVNMKSEENKIDQPWTSLFKETNHNHDRNYIIARLIEHLFKRLNQSEKLGE